MDDAVVVEVGLRETPGKNESRRLRAAGQIPGVVYGGGRDPVAVELDPRPVEGIVGSDKGLNTLIQLRVGGRELRRMVMLREVQRHPMTERIIHADFFRVELDQLVDVMVPIELIGVPIGVREEGGLVAHLGRELAVRVVAANIPEKFPVDITELHVGQHVEAKDLELPEEVELLTAPTDTIVTVVTRVVEEEPVADEEAEEAAIDEAAEGEKAETDESDEKGEGE